MNQPMSEIFLYACNFSGRGGSKPFYKTTCFKIPAFAVAYRDWGHAACKLVRKILTFLTIENLKS